MHNDTCFGSFLYSVGTQHWNLYQSSVTTSRGPILLWGPTQEPASVMCNNEQVDLFYSAGRHRNLHQSCVTTSRLTYFTLRATQEPASYLSERQSHQVTRSKSDPPFVFHVIYTGGVLNEDEVERTG